MLMKPIMNKLTIVTCKFIVMKNMYKLVTLIILFSFCTKLNAQLDTLKYLKQFEINKNQYINKPLSYLLGEMTKIQPKTIWSVPVTNKKTITRASRFKFCNMDESFNNVVVLHIIWQEEIPYSKVDYYQKKNNFYFTAEERGFYENKVVKDILVYR